MTINKLKEYHDLVQAVAAAAGISTEQATRATYTVLTVSGSDLIWTPSQRESFKSWLRSDLTVESWLSYNPTQLVQVTLAFPKIMQAYREQQQSIQAAKDEPDAP